MKGLAFAIAALALVTASASAQTTVTNTPASYVAGPRLQDAVVGIQHKALAVDYSSRAALQTTRSQGQPIALMAVGGAAIILGALMDNDARELIMVGGTVIGLYGLYLYLR